MSVLLLVLLLGGAAAAVAHAYWGFSYDDAFITYRYARSFAERGALEYNPGEAVLGTTAPGWAVALGLVARATTLAPPATGTLLSLAALVALALLLQRVAAGAGHALPTTFAALYGLLALCSRWNVELLGAEAFAVMALGTAGAALALGGWASAEGVPAHQRQAAAGLLLAAAMACRLDAALLAGMIGVALWWRHRRLPWAFAAAGVLPLLAWLGWLHREVGSVLPVTMAAKQAEADPALPGYGAAEWGWLRRSLGSGAALWLLALAAVGLLALLLAARRRRLPPAPALLAVVLIAWLLVHEVAYRLLAVPFAPWYQLPLLQGILVAAAAGALSLGAAAGARLARRERTATVIGVLAAVLLLLPPTITWGRWTIAQRHRPPDPRYPSYRTLAAAVASHAEPGDVVASMEIGVLGYYAPVRVLDLAGLVTPEVVAARREGALPRLVATRRPRFLVDADAFPEALAPLMAEPGMAARYRPLAEVRHGDDPHRRLRLLIRRAGAEQP